MISPALHYLFSWEFLTFVFLFFYHELKCMWLQIKSVFFSSFYSFFPFFASFLLSFIPSFFHF